MKILIVYRTNDLFETYVPRILAFLKEKGVEVVEKVYAREEDKQSLRTDLASWLESNATQFSHALSDVTCSHGGALYKLLYDSTIKELKNERDCGITLDSLCNDSVVKVFFTEEPEYGNDYAGLEQARAIFQKAARAVAEKIGSPEWVSIRTHALGDHQPFRNNSELAVRSLTDWIKELFPTCQVVVNDSSTGKRTWTIRDRHARENAWVSGDSLGFNLPVSTMVDDLGELNLLSGVAEEVWSTMTEILDRALANRIGAG